MNSPFLELIKVQFKEYWREPEVLFWTLAFPLAIAWVLGITFLNKPVMNYKIAVIVDDSHSLNKNSILQEAEIPINLPGRNFNEVIKVNRYNKQDAYAALKNGAVLLIVEENSGINSTKQTTGLSNNHLKSQKRNKNNKTYTFSFDPVNAEATKVYLWLEKKFSDSRIKKVFAKSNSEEGGLNKVQPVKERGRRYIDFLIPGLIALGIMNSTIWGVGWTLIEFRIKKFMRRMLATPMKKIEFMGSLSIIRLTLGLIESVILFTFAYFAFDVTIAGSLFALFFVFICGHIAFNGIAVLVASRTESSRAGNTMINVITVPLFILSGVFFNVNNFPDWMMSIVKYLPLTILADSFRLLFLNQAGFAEIIIPSATLFTTGLITYFLGIRIYKWY